METRFVNSSDGTRIAYDITGNGPALVLLHGGFVQTRRNWHDAGYVERLSREFTTITIDIRGHGESNKPETPESYSPEKIIDDLHTVATNCGFTHVALWGYSLGGTIALQAASRSKRLKGAIIGGVWFGRIFTDEMVTPFVSRAEAVIKASDEGRLEEMSLSQQERSFFDNVNIQVVLNFYRALANYPPVEPRELLCPSCLFTGSENLLALAKLKEREEEIKSDGIQLRFFEGLNHAQEFSEIETILPAALEFLHQLTSR